MSDGKKSCGCTLDGRFTCERHMYPMRCYSQTDVAALTGL